MKKIKEINTTLSNIDIRTIRTLALQVLITNDLEPSFQEKVLSLEDKMERLEQSHTL